MNYGMALQKLRPTASGYGYSDDLTATALLASLAGWPQGVTLPTAAELEAEASALEKTEVLTQAKELRDKIFSRLNGIQQDLEWNKARGLLTAAQVDPQVDGIMAAKLALKDITTYATVAAATNGAETTAALTARYPQLVAALGAVSLYAITAFNGLDV